jgi:peptidoglycan DL-endopeptidase CwlO
VLTKDNAVPPSSVALRSGLARRAAVVAASTATAAVLATLPVAPERAAVVPPSAPTVAVTAPVVPVASTRSVNLLRNSAVAAVAPAALRTAAVQKALGKVGAPYRYGASGPNAFDCSGLINWAYRTSGKSLPRSSRALSRTGTPVSRSALQPGDLVFFYRPVSHVGIYIGNGKVVHASNRKSPVKVSDMGRMPFNSARRV